MSNKNDLRNSIYNHNALTIWVYFDESLHDIRHWPTEELKQVLDDIFIYTDEQWQMLLHDIKYEQEHLS